MDQNENKNLTYKYVLYPGNNSAVIQQALSKRNVWLPISTQKLFLANLIWKPLNYSSNTYDQFDEMMRYDRQKIVMLNHFENNHLITTKSGLVRSLKHYYSHQNSIYQQNYHVFETIPTTYIVNPNKDKGELKDFLERFSQLENKNYIKEKLPSKHCQKNIWYIKPQAQNQGRGITLSNNIKQIQSIIFSKSINTSYILQKAVEKPLLYKNRKFDIRIWSLVTANFQIYYYKVPYMRTSSFNYDLSDLGNEVHLTNNSLQKNKGEYSKYQKGNTLPIQYLKEYLIQEIGKSQKDAAQIMNNITQRMKALVIDCFQSIRKLILRNQRKKQFELFGFDFLIDEDYRTWLIEVNNNPYIGTPNDFIKQLIPQMINEMFQIVIDPLFPPIDYQPVQNKNFELIHKEISFFRINPLRSGSSDNRKNYYPMKNSHDTQKNTSSSNKNRRNSEALTSLYSFQSTQKHLKVRYSTPVQSVRYLLDTYCFNDLQPFLVPVNFILTSPKLQDQQSIQQNVKNVKMITQTRICHILLQSKFIPICKKLLISQKIPEEIKICILSGYFNAIRNHKNRVEVIQNIVPTFKTLLNTTKYDALSNTSIAEQTGDNDEEIQQQQSNPLIESILMLLIRLGGNLNRKIFIPGETRQKQISRQFFISSGTLNILIKMKDRYPKLCENQLKQFLENLNSKDWDLYNSLKDKPYKCNQFQNSMHQYYSGSMRKINPDRSMTQSHLDHKLHVSFFEDKNQRLSTRDKFENTAIKSFTRQTRGALPKIKKH